MMSTWTLLFWCRSKVFLGVCVPHSEYMIPVVYERSWGQTMLNTGKLCKLTVDHGHQAQGITKPIGFLVIIIIIDSLTLVIRNLCSQHGVCVCMCMYVCMCVCVWRLACKHSKSIMPGPMKFKLGVCVPHDEYRKPIVFGADPRSFWVKTYKKCDFVKCWYFFGQIVLVNTISPDRLVRSSLNLVCVFPTMSTGTLLFLVQIQGLFW